MAVVINEMEVAPQAAPEGTPGGQPAAGDSGSKDKLKLVVKTMNKRHQRMQRLEAY
jgi:hypothetical protein